MQIVEDVVDRALRLLAEPVRDTNQSPPVEAVLFGQVIEAARILIPRRLQLRDRLLVFEEDHFHLLECSLVPLNIRVPHTLLVRHPALHDPDYRATTEQASESCNDCVTHQSPRLAVTPYP